MRPDRLYELLPVVYRQRDAERGYPLRALLQVIAEQVDVLEADIAQLYENWFIETCEDWVVPYLGDLIGYRQVHEAGEPGDPRVPQARALNKILIPRRETANTIRYRRRKGALALLEVLANDVAGWPARAVEFYKLLGWTQHLDHQRPHRGRTVDLRHGEALDRLDGPFDTLAHTVDVRRINSARTVGRYNIPSVGVFVWRLKSYSVTQTHADCLDKNPHCYTFSVLGNNSPLYTRPQRETEPTRIAGELNVPTPIRRRAFEHSKADYYGDGKSVQIWVGSLESPISAHDIDVANLADWHYRPASGRLAVDPVLGRIAFPHGHSPRKHVWVSYQYGFSTDIGGGEYDRPLSQPAGATVTRVTGHDQLKRALAPWQENQQPQEQPACAVIEIADSGTYVLPINLGFQENRSLQVRAANGCRPVIRLMNWHTDLPDALSVRGARGSRLTLDGLLITGRGVQVYKPEAEATGARQSKDGDLCDVTIRHCTLVPGWSLDCECEPCQAEEPSIELSGTAAQIKIEHSILGSIMVDADANAGEPLRLSISDSIWDATSNEFDALSDDDCSTALVTLAIARCTVFGQIRAHAIALAENCIFSGQVHVARRQTGCMRFCYVPPDSRTPRRYECQPDLVKQAVNGDGDIAPADKPAAMQREVGRVRPRFNSVRYGTPTYCQLADSCAAEIARGADDESEMGAFHDLYQPQRAANLRARLDEYTPAGMDAGIVYAT